MKTILLATAVSVALVSTANAEVGFDTRAGISYLTGEADEYVYEQGTGEKVSELNWEIDNMVLLNLGGSITATFWLKIHGDVAVSVSDSAEMTDLDWIYNGAEYTATDDNWTDLYSVKLPPSVFVNVKLLNLFSFPGQAISVNRCRLISFRAL